MINKKIKKEIEKSKNKHIKNILRTSNIQNNESDFYKENEFEDLKKIAKINQEKDFSYLDEATKLKEKDVAKTTLINDTSEIEGLFDLKKKKKKKNI